MRKYVRCPVIIMPCSTHRAEVCWDPRPTHLAVDFPGWRQNGLALGQSEWEEQAREGKSKTYQSELLLVLLSAAQPKFQGEESVVFVFFFWGGDHFLVSHVLFFWV